MLIHTYTRKNQLLGTLRKIIRLAYEILQRLQLTYSYFNFDIRITCNQLREQNKIIINLMQHTSVSYNQEAGEKRDNLR